LKFIVDVYIPEIIFHALPSVYRYYIIYYNGPPAWGSDDVKIASYEI